MLCGIHPPGFGRAPTEEAIVTNTNAETETWCAWVDGEEDDAVMFVLPTYDPDGADVATRGQKALLAAGQDADDLSRVNVERA
jgi:hypothetical protein